MVIGNSKEELISRKQDGQSTKCTGHELNYLKTKYLTNQQDVDQRINISKEQIDKFNKFESGQMITTGKQKERAQCKYKTCSESGFGEVELIWQI